MKEHVDPAMIVRTNQPGGFVRVNSAFQALVGFTNEELAQKPLVDWVVPDDRQTFLDAFEGSDEACRVRHTTSDGGSVLLEMRFQERGEDAVLLGQSIDRCPEQASDDATGVDATVKSTLHEIAKIVEEQNPGYKCSILLVAHGRFVKGAGPSLPEDYNNAIDGHAVGPTVGACGTAIYWNVPVIVDDIQKDPLWAPFAELAKKAGVAACWSHPFVSKGGRVLGALALYSPEPRTPTAEQLSRLRAAAQLTGLAVERGRAEEELRSANAVKARFMANMSHEIRTPLNALIGLADSLQDTPGAAPQDEVGMMRDSAEQLLELFTGVLELTEGQDRRHPGKVIDLRARLREIMEPLESAAREKGLDTDFELSSSVPEWVRVDEWAFERAARLVIQNAVKFTDQGSITIAVDYADRKLSARVSDTGCGIDLDRLSELREPFVQGDLSTTKKYSGFGLGLALSDLCMHALGGKLEFASNEPQGTTGALRGPHERRHSSRWDEPGLGARREGDGRTPRARRRGQRPQQQGHRADAPAIGLRVPGRRERRRGATGLRPG